MKNSIWLKHADGTFRGIYCEVDGGLTALGAMLVDNYADIDKINDLMNLGDVIGVGESIAECEPCYRENVPAVYSAKKCASVQDIVAEYNTENTYFFESGKWSIYTQERQLDAEKEIDKYFKSNNIMARPKGVYGEFDQEDLETIRLAEKSVQKEVASAQSQDRKNVREKIKEQHLKVMNDIVDKMSSGELTWQHFANVSAPKNGTSQSVYRGNNRLILGYMSAIKGYEDPRWYTFNQANTLGHSIEKGQKGTPIEIYKIWDKKEKKEVSYKELEKIFGGMSHEEKQKYYQENIRTLAKQYTVFNGEQVKGLEKYVAPMLDEKDSNERCENVLKDVTCKIFYDEKDRAYYSTSKDEIHLPDRKDFNSMQELYSTAFHEIAHSTGHISRLNRDLGGSFGDNKYAKEELIAELTSVFLQQDLGVKLGNREVENHAAYLQHWSKNAEGAEEFFKAAGSAENAATFILVKANTAEKSILAAVENNGI